MDLKSFTAVLVALLIIFSFLYNALQNLFAYSLGNIYLAILLGSLFFVDFNWLIIGYAFFLGWLSGLDSGLEFLHALFFSGLCFAFFKSSSLFEFRDVTNRYLWWLIGIGSYLIFRLLIYFYQLQLDTDFSISFVYLIWNSFLYGMLTYVYTLIIYKICRKAFSYRRITLFK
ncbi:MAG: hypothetical protein GXO57_05390 [Thermodesulfobacteria bacterium]|nr:hypothetical protein [Thermodesulfobacteriota bacterium]